MMQLHEFYHVYNRQKAYTNIKNWQKTCILSDDETMYDKATFKGDASNLIWFSAILIDLLVCVAKKIKENKTENLMHKL